MKAPSWRLGRVLGRVARPAVHPWMLRPAGEVRALADQLAAFMTRYDAAAARAGELSRERAEAEPSRPSDGHAGASEGAASAAVDPLVGLREALEETRASFAALAAALDAHGPSLQERLTALDHLALADLRQVRTLRREIRTLTDALSDADVVARRGLEAAVRLVPDTEGVNAHGGWIAALRGTASAAAAQPVGGLTAPHPVTSATGASPAATRKPDPHHEAEPAEAAPAAEPPGPHDVAHPALDTLVDAAATAFPAPGDPTAAGGAAGRLRDALRHRPPDIIAAHLRTHPDHVRQLAATTAIADVPELAALLIRSDLPTSMHRVRAVGQTFAALEPDAARRVALLHPAVVGPLDGAPTELRIEVNALLLRAELGRARRSDVDLETRAIARRVVDARQWQRRLRARAIQAWLTRDAITSVVAVDSDLPLLLRADLRIRIRLYQSLLFDQVDDGRGGRARRRLLMFDPVGRGRLAELWGGPLPCADHVAVFVPGTGTAMRGFHLPTEVAAQVAAADPDHRTAVVAWMGSDFPYATANQAIFPGFARRAAEPLRDHVAGLDIPPEATVTVIGHSYGGVMVGACELVGLWCDRVVHVASAGSGPGVRDAHDYPARDQLGRARQVRRFALTAPGDPIRWLHAVSPLWALMRRLSWWRGRPGIGLGVDPALLTGVTVLQAGAWERDVGPHRAGQPLRGPAAHAAVTAPGTQAFSRIVEVVRAPARHRHGSGTAAP